MSEWFPLGEWRRLKREEAETEAETRAKGPVIKMSMNQWCELRFTGRVRELRVCALGDVKTHQIQIVKLD
jgi:hypothetical protein